MNKIVKQFVNYVISSECPQNDKEKVEEAIQSKFDLTTDRSVFYCDYFAVRVSFTKNTSFSNTVLSLSELQKYDEAPFFVILVSGVNNNKVLLANTTFLQKISHSSQELSTTNIRGSFNGGDIIRNYRGLENNAANFEKLFAYHQSFTWEENLQRLVDATSKITPTGNQFEVPSNVKKAIYNSIDRAEKFVNSANFSALNRDLNERVKKCADSILVASKIENVNIRGRLIEALITSDNEERKKLMQDLAKAENNLPDYDTKNDLGDYKHSFFNIEAYTDIKTKIVYLNSNPKAYNIDKFLEAMEKEDTVFFFYFVGINEQGITNTILCSVYHKELIEGTIKQYHWAGRNSRGVTQFKGETIDRMLKNKSFKNIIDKNRARQFIDHLLEEKE